METERSTLRAAAAYMPAASRHVLAHGLPLPEQTLGAALFADVGGFTPLTEALARALGPRRGAEELGRYLGLVYDAIIAPVDLYGGSVVSFAGDAITVWFAEDLPPGTVEPAALRAAACALAIQDAMRAFAALEIPGLGLASLSVKLAVASGPARRFVVGDPSVQLMPAIAGSTIARMAAGESHAGLDDVVVDRQTTLALGSRGHTGASFGDTETGWQFSVLTGLDGKVSPAPWPPLPEGALSEESVRRWLLPAVYGHLRAGTGDFLTELRPAVALFLRFGGIDYDRDKEAAAKLGGYISWLQSVARRFDGNLLQVTHGDKGSYAYMAFGAPVAHEDDARRALSAALELRQPPPEFGFIDQVQIGVARGPMRTGAYGGSTRRTYGVLGDDVNLSARLMQRAPSGQILVSESAYAVAARDFTWEALPPLAVKGKTEPVAVYRLLGACQGRSVRLQEPRYALPMIGRREQLAAIEEKLALALSGKGQVVGIAAEAGMGKSRLVAEVLRLAEGAGVASHGGECQSYGANTPYLVWRSVWHSLFGLDSTCSLEEQVDVVQTRLAHIQQALVARLPLLGVLLNLPIADNDLTRSFDAKLRKSSLESLLIDCLRALAGAARVDSGARQRSSPSDLLAPQPRLLVLEDCHWLDPLSADLLEAIGRAMADLPVLIVIAYRPGAEAGGRVAGERLATLPHFTEIRLQDLTAADSDALIDARLRHVFGGDVVPSPVLRERIAARAQGNPFYMEELLNYLKDHGIDPGDGAAIGRLDLPASLHSLVLSRMDQLGERQQMTLKVASIIGRLFRFNWLWGVYPDVGLPDQVREDLDALGKLDLTPLDQVEPELIYLFKHIVTQEVAYESQPHGARAAFHGRLGGFLERLYAESPRQYVDLLAFHYDRSDNLPKRREYLRKAGDAAQAAYANAAAIDYLQRVLPLLAEGDEREVRLALGQVHEVVGQYDDADVEYRTALRLAESAGDDATVAKAQRAIGWLSRKKGSWVEAAKWLELAHRRYQARGDTAGASQTLAEIGEIHRLQGRLDEAKGCYQQSLLLADALPDRGPRLAAQAHALRGAGTVASIQGDHASARRLYGQAIAICRETSNKPGLGVLLVNLGLVARLSGNLAEARQLNDESLAIFREVGDRWALGTLLNNQGCVLNELREFAEAKRLLGESLAIGREVGDKQRIATSLNSLADVYIDEGDHAPARPLLEESLKLAVEMDDQAAAAYLIEDFAGIAAAEGKAIRALELGGFAANLREAIGAPLAPGEKARVDRLLAAAWAATPAEDARRAWNHGEVMALGDAAAYALGG